MVFASSASLSVFAILTTLGVGIYHSPLLDRHPLLSSDQSLFHYTTMSLPPLGMTLQLVQPHLKPSIGRLPQSVDPSISSNITWKIAFPLTRQSSESQDLSRNCTITTTLMLIFFLDSPGEHLIVSLDRYRMIMMAIGSWPTYWVESSIVTHPRVITRDLSPPGRDNSGKIYHYSSQDWDAYGLVRRGRSRQ